MRTTKIGPDLRLRYFDVIQLTLSQKMTTAQVFEASFTVINSHIQDYSHPDDHVQFTYEMTPGFQPFTC